MAAEREIDLTDTDLTQISFEDAQGMIGHFKTIAKVKK